MPPVSSPSEKMPPKYDVDQNVFADDGADLTPAQWEQLARLMPTKICVLEGLPSAIWFEAREAMASVLSDTVDMGQEKVRKLTQGIQSIFESLPISPVLKSALRSSIQLGGATVMTGCSPTQAVSDGWNWTKTKVSGAYNTVVDPVGRFFSDIGDSADFQMSGSGSGAISRVNQEMPHVRATDFQQLESVMREPTFWESMQSLGANAGVFVGLAVVSVLISRWKAEKDGYPDGLGNLAAYIAGIVGSEMMTNNSFSESCVYGGLGSALALTIAKVWLKNSQEYRKL